MQPTNVNGGVDIRCGCDKMAVEAAGDAGDVEQSNESEAKCRPGT